MVIREEFTEGVDRFKLSDHKYNCEDDCKVIVSRLMKKYKIINPLWNKVNSSAMRVETDVNKN